MKKVAVMMSTYNGEKYLAAQINSILTQKDVIVYLFVRDDGSTDNTRSIISGFTKKNERIWFINQDENKNYGFCESFLSIMSYVLENYEGINFFSFADQDDIWLPNKLKAAVTMLAEHDIDKPTLYFSNKTFVDKDLNLIAEEDYKYYDDFYSLFRNAGASGCTMVFNRALAKIADMKRPAYTFYHDLWLYRIARCIGAKIVFDRVSHIYYRQHGANVSGMEGCITNVFRTNTLFKKKEHKLQKALNEIAENYSDMIDDNNKKYLEYVKDYDRNIKSSILLAIDPLALKRGVRSYLFWWTSVIRRSI